MRHKEFLKIVTTALFALVSIIVPAIGSDNPEIYVQTGHAKPVTYIAASENERYLVTSEGLGFLKIWEIASGREIRTLKPNNTVTNLYFTGNDTFMVITRNFSGGSANYGTATLYNTYGEQLDTISLPSLASYDKVYITQSKKYIYTVSESTNKTRFFDINDGAEIKLPEVTNDYDDSQLLNLGFGFFGVFYDSYKVNPVQENIGKTAYVIYDEDLKVIKRGLMPSEIYIGTDIKADSALKHIYKNRNFGNNPMLTLYDLDSGAPVCSTASFTSSRLAMLPDGKVVLNCSANGAMQGVSFLVDKDIYLIEFLDNCLYKLKNVFHKKASGIDAYELANNALFVANYDSCTVTMYDYSGRQQVKSFGVKPQVFFESFISKDKVLNIQQTFSVTTKEAVLNFNVWNLNNASLERCNVENTTTNVYEKKKSIKQTSGTYDYTVWTLSDPDAFFSQIPQEFFPPKYKKKYEDFYDRAMTVFAVFLNNSGDSTVLCKKMENYISIYNKVTKTEIAKLYSFTDREWIVITPEGYFNASPNGAKYLNVRVGRQVYSVDNFYEKYYNPSYVASVLQGGKVEVATDIRKGIALPPDIKFITPANGTEVNSDEIKIDVSATDMGGGIDEIRLYQNGKALDEDTRGIRPVPKNNESITSFNITLVDGINIFRAVGFSKDRTASNPIEIQVKLTAPRKDVSMHVVTVGINNYENPALNLNYAEPDARGIADFFRKSGNELFKNITVADLYNDQATKADMLQQLKQLENTDPQDVVVIYLAGHGENIGDAWYFIPYELTYPEREDEVKAKAVSSDELAVYIKKIKAQKVLVLIDACKSGAVLMAFRGFEDRKALSQLSRAVGIHIVAASTKDQFATEVKELGHGVFTYTLLQGLMGKAAMPGEAVTVRKLIAYIEEQLPDLTRKYKQEAQYPVIDSKGMDFPVVKNQ